MAVRRHRQTGFPTASEKWSEMKIFSNGYPLKPLEMTYLVGKHGRIQFELVFDGPWAKSVSYNWWQFLKAEEHSCGCCTDPCHSWWGGSLTQKPTTRQIWGTNQVVLKWEALAPWFWEGYQGSLGLANFPRILTTFHVSYRFIDHSRAVKYLLCISHDHFLKEPEPMPEAEPKSGAKCDALMLCLLFWPVTIYSSYIHPYHPIETSHCPHCHPFTANMAGATSPRQGHIGHWL